MNRRNFLQTLAAAPAAVHGAAAKRPNVLLIMADDQGFGDVAIHGNPWLETPTLDRLAKEGVEFTRFHACPVCAPTRASLLTGRYHVRSGVHGVTAGREAMSLDEVTIAQSFRDAGYRTGMFGKWHLGMHYPYVPHARGFQEFTGFRTGHFIDYFDPLLEHNGQPAPQKGYITDILTHLTRAFIEQQSNEPFFAYLAYNVPHMPYMVPDRFWKKYSKMDLPPATAAAYALTECMDENMGALLRRLTELNLDENTIVLFLSDNGPNGNRFNSGLRGIKGSIYEGGTREPFFIRWKGQFKGGTRVPELTSVIDICPTLLDLCEVKRSAPAPPLDGLSLAPLLRGKPGGWPDRDIFIRSENRQRPDFAYPGVIRSGKFNFVNGKELYDFEHDPGEHEEVAAKFPVVAARMKAAYETWFRDAVPAGGFRRFPIPVGYAAENPSFLPAPEADLSGGLRYFGTHGYAWDWVTNWTNPEARVRWDIDIVREGSYRVTAEYLCPEGSTGAEIEASVQGQSVKGVITKPTSMEPIPNRDVVPRTEVPRMHWATLDLGALTLRKGRADLVVSGLSKTGPAVMDLNRVGLTFLQ